MSDIQQWFPGFSPTRFDAHQRPGAGIFFYEICVKNGNWVPVCKAAVKTLPINRAFSEVEALFSLSCDYDNSETVSETGMAKRWGWSRKKVRLFLKRIGVEILYQVDKKHSPLGGRVGIQLGDDLGTSKGRVRFIDFNNLDNKGDDLGTSKGRVRDELGATTIDPDPNPDPNPKEKDLKPFVETSNEVRQDGFHFIVTQKIAKWVRSKKNVNIDNRKITAWANQVRLLIEKDLRGEREEKEKRVDKALEWYLENAGGEHIVVIESGGSFRDKFIRLETAMIKDTSSENRWDEVRKEYGN